MNKTIDICRDASIASTEFEKTNTDLKREYLLINIYLYNYITAKIEHNRGTFGTGYPFYALNPDLTGVLPIIEEQIRYNNGLLEAINKTDITEWPCANCLFKNYGSMPDLKVKCKPCKKLDDALKPRKVLNRLPDIDLWMVCDDDYISYEKDNLSFWFKTFNLQPSDINPVKTIEDLKKISADLKNGVIPSRMLPLDSHIIGYIKLYSLIEQVPYVLDKAIKNGDIPFLPILPLSLRKKWQHDDTPYNFIHDYLYGFYDFNLDAELKQLLDDTRRIVANSYSTDKLFEIATLAGSESVARRNKTKVLRHCFEERINSWKK